MKCSKCNFNNAPGARFCAQCGTGLDLYDTPTENIRAAIREIDRGTILFGRYEVIESIGSGGMGTVYRVFDKKINEMIALKIIRPEIATDRSVIERFNQELKIARQISHRNICRVFDIGEETGINYITMEFITGEDLRTFVRRIGQLPVPKTIDIARQICEGLAEAHTMGIIHRDLKPQNIMIDRDGRAKIMDFGIARVIRTKGLTTTGTIIGTPEYMSPEQAEGKGIDQRSDIYSLGILLFEATTGMVPFEGDTPISIALKHRTERPPDPRRFNAQIPPDLSGLILKCLEKEKSRRYQTVAEIIADLDMIEGRIQRAGGIKKSRRRRKSSAASGAKGAFVFGGVVVALAALALGVWHFWPREEAGSGSADTTVAQGETRLIESEPVVSAPEQEKVEAPRQREPEKQELSPVAVAKEPPAEKSERDERKMIEDRIRADLETAGAAFRREAYQECLNHARAVLKIAPDNAQAKDYVERASAELAKAQAVAEINLMIDGYIDALRGNPIDFLKSRCTSEAYQELIDEGFIGFIEIYFNQNEGLESSYASSETRVLGEDKAEASFSQRVTGKRKGTGMQTAFNGRLNWSLDKRNGEWKIAKYVFRP